GGAGRESRKGSLPWRSLGPRTREAAWRQSCREVRIGPSGLRAQSNAGRAIRGAGPRLFWKSPNHESNIGRSHDKGSVLMRFGDFLLILLVCVSSAMLAQGGDLREYVRLFPITDGDPETQERARTNTKINSP